MKTARLFPSLLLAAAMSALLSPAARAADKETTSIKFTDPAKPGTLRVSLGHGDLRITGADVAEITVKSELKPESAAQRKDGLRVLSSSASYTLTEKANVALLDHGSDSWFGGGGGDFEVTVPRSTAVIISSNLGGDITVSGLAGDVEVKNMNGEIKLADLAGGVLVETMNGEIDATFREVRADKPLSFSSMNGEITLRVPADAKATIRLRTHHGEIATSFDEKSLVTKIETSGRMKNAIAPAARSASGSEIHEVVHEAVRAGMEAAREIAVAAREAASAAREAAQEARDEARSNSDADRATQDNDAPRAPRAPRTPRAPLPPMTGGKIVSGVLNGGGPELRVSTMNGDVKLLKTAAK